MQCDIPRDPLIVTHVWPSETPVVDSIVFMVCFPLRAEEGVTGLLINRWKALMGWVRGFLRLVDSIRQCGERLAAQWEDQDPAN